MKLMWTGSDVLYATWAYGKRFPTKKSKIPYFYGCTLFAKIADLFVEEHYVVSEHMIDRLKPLKLRKSIEVLADPPKSFKLAVKTPHDSFFVLYYVPFANNQKFINWVYGWDIIESVRNYFSDNENVSFLRVDGTHEIDKIYSLTDCYIRPNRSDGNPRMIMECEQLGIQYYWTKENPNAEDVIAFIEKELVKKN